MNSSALVRRQPRALLIAELIGIVAAVGYVDYITGREVTLFVLYALPIFLAAWYVDRRWAMVCAVLSAFAWWAANLKVQIFATDWGYIVAAITRLAYFVFVAIGGAALRAQRDANRARIVTLEQNSALKQDILRISEREQQRIGQELHDGLCQYLAAIACAAKCLRDDLEHRRLPEAAAATEIEDLLIDAVKQARSLARGIFPVQMDEYGLPAALEELATLTSRLMPVSVTFESRGDICIADPQVAMHLYRIAQEALGNALKHGNARNIVISLDTDDRHLKLMVKDNGAGFGKNPHWQPGMGMKTMQYRAREIGADLSIGNLAVTGCTVTCSVPHTDGIRSVAVNDLVPEATDPPAKLPPAVAPCEA